MARDRKSRKFRGTNRVKNLEVSRMRFESTVLRYISSTGSHERTSRRHNKPVGSKRGGGGGADLSLPPRSSAGKKE